MMTEINNKKDYFRETVLKNLRETFLQNKEADPNFSLRAYARLIDIDPTFLSRILSGKKKLTYKTALRIANKLDLPIDQILDRFTERRNLSEDIFSPISRWYFFVILELNKLFSFKKDKSWIAQKIGISDEEVEEALQILSEQGHLNSKDDNWDVTLYESRWDGVKDPSERKRNFQKQVIRKAHNAIDKFPPTERDAYSMAIAADPDTLPLIKQKIRNLSEEIVEICENSQQKKHVYQLHCSFFALTNDIEDTGEVS